ncbi:50S ribosomal protein L4 [Patescibacteria group bacterium]|nr:50S ribosomal protein L4 [Patescibacteria group bacterium]
MSKVKVYNLEGEVIKEEELDPKIFNIEAKPKVIQLVVEALMANQRKLLAHTKGRSEVKGGGRKPWRQKGTGRARHGSIRSPLWKGGGITFGPTKERNFYKSINKKVRNKALKMVLSDKVNHQHLILVEDITLKEPKTKKLAELLKKLPLKERSTLIVLDKKDKNLLRASHNLPKIATEPVESLNVIDLLKFEYLLTTLKAIKKISKFYTLKTKV